MKAYKAFNINENGDLQCRDMIYKVGETYEMNETPVLCERGFHACLDINDLDVYYDIIRGHGLILGKTTVCEVELLSGVEEENNDYLSSKVATNKIKIIRQLSTKETLTKLNALDYSSRPEISMILNHSTGDLTHDQLDIILQGEDLDLIQGVLEKRSPDDYLLDKIVNHSCSNVRSLLLSLNLYRDKDLDILVQDDDPAIREAIAKKGRDKDLDILVHDNDNWVRSEVASRRRDKDLDILIHDKSYWVRMIVANQGRDKHLDILVHDKSYFVRTAVAKHGRDKDLDILVHDNHFYVRSEAARQGRDKDLDIFVYDKDHRVQGAVAKHGRIKDLDVIAQDTNNDVKGDMR